MQEGLKLTWKDKQTTRQDKNKETKPTQNEPKNKNNKTNQKTNNTKQNKEEVTVYYYVAQYNLL